MSRIMATNQTMSPVKHWAICPPAPRFHIQAFGYLPPLIVQLLYNRGITSGEEIDAFMGHRLHDDNPFKLAGMNEAVARIRKAIKDDERITVYGDFDADGVTATALLVETLRSLGAQVEPYIPDRVDEGYGLNCDALERIAGKGATLVITVDCGIRSIEEVTAGRRLGLDMIVTDHHTVGDVLPPAVACINPRRSDSAYPFRELAGVGVAYKLAQALLRVENRVPNGAAAPLKEEELLDLVALGTVADLMPLIGENRTLVRRGLERINQTSRPGLAALMREAGARQGGVNSTTIAFFLAPRLNAAGRLETAMHSYALLTATDTEEAAGQARQLGHLNQRRQRLTDEAVEVALAQLAEDDAPDDLIFVADTRFLPGIVGLVAGRLAETFYRPSIVVEVGDLHSRGSCRSIAEFHITEALDRCSRQGLLMRHGGHAAAAGFTVETKHLARLQDALRAIAAETLAGQTLAPALIVDALVDLQALDWATHEVIIQLEPFGYGNPTPILASRNVKVVDKRTVGSDGKHLKLTLSDGRRDWSAIAFRQGHMLGDLPERVDIAYHLEQNEWNGRTSLQLNIQDIRPAETTDSAPTASF
jgi:single-stranded-DNA-specific exonuclease